MAQRITWDAPPAPLVAARHDVYSAPSAVGTYALVATLPGSKLAFVDDDGTDATVYRVKTYNDSDELVLDTGPFQSYPAQAAGLLARVKVDHDYPSVDNLRYVYSGTGIPDATVRIFRAADWDQGRRDVARHVTTTDATGRWSNPAWLEPGLDYVVVVGKPGAYGPDSVVITV